MLRNYLLTLGLTVILLSYGISLAPFVTHSAVLAGKSVDEDLKFEFTLDIDSHTVYAIDAELAQIIKEGVRLRADGVIRLGVPDVSVTPQRISWKEGRTTYKASGAAIAVKLRWDTPADSANGAQSHIYLDFSGIPELQGKKLSMHAGGYNYESQDVYAIRDALSYTSSFQLGLAQLYLAMVIGLPAGIVLHAVGWHFLVLRGEKRARIAALPADGNFHPNPLAEWEAGLRTLGWGSFIAGIFAMLGALEGYVSQYYGLLPYGILAVSVLLVPVVLIYTRKNVLTIRVTPEGLSYARGRDNLQWAQVPWSSIVKLSERSYKGNYWIEIKIQDQWGKIKLNKNAMADYPGLRTALKVA
jgi:hypothetical protein